MNPETTDTAPRHMTYKPMVYDSGRGVFVLFGEQPSNFYNISDTWEFDGTDWTEQKPATRPPAPVIDVDMALRCVAELKQHNDLNLVVLLGGEPGLFPESVKQRAKTVRPYPHLCHGRLSTFLQYRPIQVGAGRIDQAAKYL